MAIYLAVSRVEGRPLPEPADFSPCLPFGDAHPPEVSVFDRGPGRLIVWSWGGPLDRAPVEEGRVVCFTQGYGRPQLEDDLRTALGAGRPPADDFGSFSSVQLDDDGWRAYASLAGTSPIYRLQLGRFFALSNRVALLSALGPLTTRREALMSLAGATFLQDFGSSFEEIDRIRPGELWSVEGDRRHSRRRPLALEPRMSLAEARERLKPALKRLAGPLEDPSRALRLNLSGGKDSRAVLALLDRAGRVGPDLEVSTSGRHHNPEVLAAQDLLARYPHDFRHRVAGQPASPDPSAVGTGLVRTLFAWEGAMSLADRAAYHYDVERLSIGGHELGMKYHPNPAPLETYLEAPRYDVDPFSVLRPEAEADARSRYAALLKEVLPSFGVDKYRIAEEWFLRIPNYTAHGFLCHAPASHQYHPFLDISFLGFLASCPSEMTQSQLLHWLITSEASVELRDVPFADDIWPHGVRTLAAELGLPPVGVGTPPYRFDARFPETPARGMYPWRLERLRLARGFLRNQGLPPEMDFVEPAALERRLGLPETEVSLQDIYSVLGVFNAALQARYGAALLDRRRHADLEAELLDAAQMARASVGATPTESVDAVVDRYDRALAAFVREDHHHRRLDDAPSYAALRRGRGDAAYSGLGARGWRLRIRLRGTELRARVIIPWVTWEGEPGRPGLASVWVDGAPLEAVGLALSPRPDIGAYRYLNATPGLVEHRTLDLPLPSGSRTLELWIRPWEAEREVFFGAPIVTDAGGRRLEVTCAPEVSLPPLRRLEHQARKWARATRRRVRSWA